MVWAILATILCCQIPGIVAIVYAAQVSSKLLAGDYAGAVDSSNKAKIWCWVAAGLWLIGVVIYGLILVIAGVTGFSSEMR